MALKVVVVEGSGLGNRPQNNPFNNVHRCWVCARECLEKGCAVRRACGECCADDYDEMTDHADLSCRHAASLAAACRQKRADHRRGINARRDKKRDKLRKRRMRAVEHTHDPIGEHPRARPTVHPGMRVMCVSCPQRGKFHRKNRPEVPRRPETANPTGCERSELDKGLQVGTTSGLCTGQLRRAGDCEDRADSPVEGAFPEAR